MASLTAANAVITLTIPGLFNSPVQLQGFSAQNIYEMPSIEINQTQMGVDGKLSAGFVYNPISQTFVLQADSASNDVFEIWAQTMLTNRDTLRCNGETLLTSVNRSYVCTNGALTSYPPAPAAGQILQPRSYVIVWERISATPV
jgi:hypothetical protein